ncbi:MAG: hypothetical protein GDA53_09640 [Rhodobacteraceae bacterium]|nr:hypothetical protein [Paracoccaceae bacterium]
MRRLLILLLVLLTGCDIRRARPDFEYPAASTADGTGWPVLGETAVLADAEKGEDRTDMAGRLIARARVLEARVARFSR